MTAVEEQVSSMLGTSVTVVPKRELTEYALPDVKNALISVPAGENATVQVDYVNPSEIQGVDLTNAVALTLELYNGSNEKMNLKAPVIVTLPIPDGIDEEKEISVYHFYDNSTDYAEVIKTRVDTENHTLTFVTGSFCTFTIVNAPDGYEVYGKASSFGDEAEPVTIQLRNGDEVVAETTVCGNSAEYNFTQIPSGTYTIRIDKKNHVAREYSVVVEDEDIQQDVEIWLKGDVNGDGTVNVKDNKKLYGHIAGSSTLTDYALIVGDVNGDGTINVKDNKKLYSYIAGTSTL
jgi:hypothetical protein